MDVNVKLLGSSNPTYENFSIRLSDSNETVGEIKSKIAQRLKLKRSSTIRLVFSGQYLSNDQQRVGDLELGPSTYLNALIADIADDDEQQRSMDVVEKYDSINDDDHSSPRHWRSRFFVYCKNTCNELTPGKLRVRCSVCKSSAVLVAKEPNSWNDILTRGSIKCECLENGCRHSPSSPEEEEPNAAVDSSSSSLPAVEFYFKCSQCSTEEGVVPLPQIKPMRSDGNVRPCSICSEDGDGTRMIIFSCDSAHSTCSDCFVAYATEKLERRSFVMHPTIGYTLPCPEPRCHDGFIVDSHHFRLLGNSELYEKYHRLAAEIYLLGEGGMYCPKVNCGEAFIADVVPPPPPPGRRSQDDYSDSDDAQRSDRRLILCPKCGWAFCYYCRMGASECHCATLGVRRDPESIASRMANAALPSMGGAASSTSDEMRSFVTIHSTTKSCPNCRAPTEKNEGCNHMTCAQCSFDWCWDCEKRWTEDCQWNHWFD